MRRRIVSMWSIWPPAHRHPVIAVEGAGGPVGIDNDAAARAIMTSHSLKARWNGARASVLSRPLTTSTCSARAAVVASTWAAAAAMLARYSTYSASPAIPATPSVNKHGRRPDRAPEGACGFAPSRRRQKGSGSRLSRHAGCQGIIDRWRGGPAGIEGETAVVGHGGLGQDPCCRGPFCSGLGVGGLVVGGLVVPGDGAFGSSDAAAIMFMLWEFRWNSLKAGGVDRQPRPAVQRQANPRPSWPAVLPAVREEVAGRMR